MKILLHICCAPCAIYPLKVLRKNGHDVWGHFYNPNIHPYLEYKKRFDALKEYADSVELKTIPHEEYPMEEFLRSVVFREENRCKYCYYSRLENTVHIAKRAKLEGFTTTLLYSKFQDHEMIKGIGENLAKEHGVKFYYHDFREGWKEGIRISKDLGMYRQQYCGCIYSEKERFYHKKKS